MIGEIYNGIGSAIQADSTIITELGGTKIFSEVASQTATKPYIVMQIMAGGDENIYAQAGLDVVVSVLCVASTGGKASTVASRLRAVLHENTAINLGTAWSAHRCQHRTATTYTEVIDRVPIFYAGGTYRLRARKL